MWNSIEFDVLDDIDMDWSCYANDTCTLCLINGTPTKCLMKCLSDVWIWELYETAWDYEWVVERRG